ncbi:hypothetical protein [Nonomuraea rubra]|uniref:Biotin operon repressor n=1 Tax=Nonomuraea rubra TaxID=46180 RepID=A0A7X0U5N8_9ACTN|nr:hypothetical protein [Nonomuraea rubra]MBB6556217.1 biotin operon repressor [Nonomuraea rubra]
MTDDERSAGPSPAGLNQAAIDWAWAQPVANNPGARITLLCLARLVDEAWECEASQEEVAVEAMLSSRTVRRQLEQLEQDGFVARLKRFDDKGHRLPDRCRLNPGMDLSGGLASRDFRSSGPQDNLSAGAASQRTDCPPVNLSAGPDQGECSDGLPDRLTGGQIDLWPDCPVGDDAPRQNPSSDPQDRLTSGQIVRAICVNNSSSSKEEEQKPSTTKGGAGGKPTRQATKEHPRFAEWYAAYPLRKERAAAVKAFNKAAAKVEDVQILFDAAKLYADTDPHVLRGYIKNPATWLNKECWLDEPAPRLALVRNDAPSPGSTPQQFTEEEYRAGW